ncbi:putative AH/BAR domain superfamily protein [Helianthus annuus]|nr:putative AH/BAR domain superfamily protein [Helianthus annuus]
MQGDDISNDPSACREILGGLGTLFEVDRARAASHELRINQLSTMLVGSSIVANAIMEDYKLLSRREEEAARMRSEAEKLVRAARAGAEQLEKDKAAFEKHKQTEEWAATAKLKHVRSLTKLLSEERKNWKETLSNERKTWKESWAKQNENLFRARQELANLKAANAALAKEKAAAEAAAGRAKEDEARTTKALEEAKKAGARFANALDEANADRTRLKQTVLSLQAEVQTREAKLADITARVTVAEERANEAVEARDALTSSFNQLEADREWMRSHGIAHTTIGIDLIKQRARDAGFKAGYNRCIGHINVLSQGGYTNERSGFRDMDTEARLKAAVASFYDMSLSSVKKLDECLDAAD